MTAHIEESRVVKIWQDCAGRNDLETEEDGPVKVVYPGRINDGGGADFRDAVIQTGRGILTGDIEIHVKASHWRAHRHHLDPLYNRVVLHVVFRNDTATSAVLENGHSVPTLALHKTPPPVEKSGFTLFRITCCGSNIKRDNIPGVLDAAGEQRFQSRAAGFQAVTSPGEAEQALYRGIMAALGYVKNKQPMAELACRMPLRGLESMVTAEMPVTGYLAVCQAMLLGAAGLLTSQRVPRREEGANERRLSGLERLWLAAGDIATMSESDWQFFRVRPGNLPARRIIAMSYLLLRFRKEGLLNGLISKLDEVSVDSGQRKLEEVFIINSGECTGKNTGSGQLLVSSGTALLGRDRAADIVINVFLPFAVAWGRVNARPELAEKAMAIYRRYPPLASNTLQRHMNRQLGIDNKMANTARRQQGLLHLFKTFCSLGACQDCPLYKPV
jgi:hypothetical protein